VSILNPGRLILEKNREIQVILPDPPSTVALAASNISSSGFRANWVYSPYADYYRLYVSTDPTFATYVTGYNGKAVSHLLNYEDLSGLASGTYYYRVRVYGSGGLGPVSNTITAETLVVIVNDTLVGADGTLLTTHVGEVGAAWSVVSGNNTRLSGSNSAFNSAAGESWQAASGVPPTINYFVEAQFQMRSAMIGVNDGVNLFVRHNGGRRVSIFFANLAAQWQLYGPDDALKATY
jgi:hypothetical protein